MVVAGLGLSRRAPLERVGNIGRSTIVEERKAAINGRVAKRGGCCFERPRDERVELPAVVEVRCAAFAVIGGKRVAAIVSVLVAFEPLLKSLNKAGDVWISPGQKISGAALARQPIVFAIDFQNVAANAGSGHDFPPCGLLVPVVPDQIATAMPIAWRMTVQRSVVVVTISSARRCALL